MSTSENILEELVKSMTKGNLLGLLIRFPSTSTFVITKVKEITEDPADPENRIISLFSTDIHGNVISHNPVMSRNIEDVRPYYRLSGNIE